MNMKEIIKPVLTTIVNHEGVDGILYDFIKGLYKNESYEDNEENRKKLYDVWQILKHTQENVWTMSIVLGLRLKLDLSKLSKIIKNKEIFQIILETFKVEDYIVSKLSSIISINMCTYEQDSNLQILYEHLMENGNFKAMRMISMLPLSSKVELSKDSFEKLVEVEGWQSLMKFCLPEEEQSDEISVKSETSGGDAFCSEENCNICLLDSDSETESNFENENESDYPVLGSQNSCVNEVEKIVEGKPIDIETVTKILYERYRFGNKGEELKKCKKNPSITDSAFQAAGNMKRIAEKFKEIGCLWKIPEVVEKLMSDKEYSNINTKSQLLTAISVTLKHLTDEEKTLYIGNEDVFKNCVEKVNKYHKILICIKIESQEDQILSESEEAIMLQTDWKQLTEEVNNFTNKYRSVDKIETRPQLELVLRLIIASLYVTEHVPRRLEYLTVKWRNFDVDEDNYYDKGIITLNDYKTSANFKQYRFAIDEKLEREFSKLQQYREEEDNDYLFGFEQQVQSSYKTTLVQKVFETICGLRLSVNILRKLFINYATNSGNLQWSTQKKDLANKMAHSVKLQQGTYTKRVRTIEPQRSVSRKRIRTSPNSEQEELLHQEISRAGNEKCQWSKVKNDNEIFKDVPLKTITNWGINLKSKII